MRLGRSRASPADWTKDGVGPR